MKQHEYTNKLTVLIPLWGREKHTKNLLNHLNEIEMPFKLLLADGGGTDLSSWINTDSFLNLDLTYINCGRDTCIHDFMSKMNIACSTITTPFTIMVDNDDTPDIDGLTKGIEFLSANDDYASYRGNVRSSGKPVYTQPGITDEHPIDRFRFPNGGMDSDWHNIVRTNTLQTFFEIMDKSKTNDLQLVWTVNRYWHTLFGKSHKDNTIPYYYHVPGSSLVYDKGLYSKTTKWMQDETFVDSMAIAISMVYNLIEPDGREEVTNRMLTWLIDLNGYTDSSEPVFNAIIKKSYDYDELVIDVLNKGIKK